jgi:hypothetical protein
MAASRVDFDSKAEAMLVERSAIFSVFAPQTGVEPPASLTSGMPQHTALCEEAVPATRLDGFRD